MSERSELFSLPDFRPLTPGTPKGLRPSGRLSLLTFFGEAKKVSSRRATPGKVDRRKKNRSYHIRLVGTKNRRHPNHSQEKTPSRQRHQPIQLLPIPVIRNPL